MYKNICKHLQKHSCLYIEDITSDNSVFHCLETLVKASSKMLKVFLIKNIARVHICHISVLKESQNLPNSFKNFHKILSARGEARALLQSTFDLLLLLHRSFRNVYILKVILKVLYSNKVNSKTNLARYSS